MYKTYAYLSIVFLFSVFFFFFHCIVHTFVFYSDNLSIYYANTINKEFIIKANILATLCNIFFNIGATIGVFYKTKINLVKFFNKFRHFDEKSLFRTGLIMFTIGAITKLVYFTILGNGNLFYYIQNYFAIQLTNASDGGSFTNYLTYIFALIDIGSDMILINLLQYKTHKKFSIFIILFALLISFNSRMAIIKLLFEYLLLSCIYITKLRKNIPYIFVCICLPIILSLVCGLGLYRDYTNGKEINHEQKNPIITNLYFVVGAFHTMRTISDVLEFENTFGHKTYGRTIILPIIQKPIPRSIWKNKELNAAAVYTETMHPGYIENGLAIAPGIVFDSYINFGYIGTLIFFMFVGFFLFQLQYILIKNIDSNSNNIFPVLILVVIISNLIILRGTDISNFIITLSYLLIPLILIFFKIRIKI